ncbi:hypothetical protein GQ53DRAFT_825791 [Thozetella sp. PMI_491]|nr:hypothetical protein GQ53DRAFT_825791 [Thozetella sp. PMI_491]
MGSYLNLASFNASSENGAETLRPTTKAAEPFEMSLDIESEDGDLVSIYVQEDQFSATRKSESERLDAPDFVPVASAAATYRTEVSGKDLLTDSGYGSSNRTNVPPARAIADSNSENTMDPPADINADARTRYSGGSVLVSGDVQQAVLAVCDDIIAHFPVLSNRMNQKFLQEDLSTLVRAFAIELGLDSGLPLACEIMHFVHRYSR